jgi:hypothetical protein
VRGKSWVKRVMLVEELTLLIGMAPKFSMLRSPAVLKDAQEQTFVGDTNLAHTHGCIVNYTRSPTLLGLRFSGRTNNIDIPSSIPHHECLDISHFSLRAFTTVIKCWYAFSSSISNSESSCGQTHCGSSMASRCAQSIHGRVNAI